MRVDERPDLILNYKIPHKYFQDKLAPGKQTCDIPNFLGMKFETLHILGQTSDGQVVISLDALWIVVLSLNSSDLSLKISKWFKIPVKGRFSISAKI